MADLVEEIKSLVRNEKNSRSKLKDIPETFFKNAAEEVQRLKEELKIAVEKNQVEYMTQVSFRIKAIENGVKELKGMRARKIALQAIEDAISATKGEMNGFIPEERILYEELKKSFEFYISGNNVPLPIKEVPEERKIEEKKQIEKKVAVRILMPIEVADIDKDYILNREDIVTITEDLANVLSKKGICEIIKF
ncbi:MAG: hypothetical protein ACP5R0_05240 [Thermoplasmata archaeon]